MTKILSVIGVAALSFSVTGCGSTNSPASPTSLARVPGGINAGEPTAPAEPRLAAGAKPGNLTIVGIVLQDDDEFDVLQAAVVRAGLVEALNGTKQ